MEPPPKAPPQKDVTMDAPEPRTPTTPTESPTGSGKKVVKGRSSDADDDWAAFVARKMIRDEEKKKKKNQSEGEPAKIVDEREGEREGADLKVKSDETDSAFSENVRVFPKKSDEIRERAEKEGVGEKKAKVEKIKIKAETIGKGPESLLPQDLKSPKTTGGSNDEASGSQKGGDNKLGGLTALPKPRERLFTKISVNEFEEASLFDEQPTPEASPAMSSTRTLGREHGSRCVHRANHEH